MNQLREQFIKQSGIDMNDTTSERVFPYYKEGKWVSITRGGAWKMYAEWIESKITSPVGVTDEMIKDEANTYGSSGYHPALTRAAFKAGANYVRSLMQTEPKQKQL